MNRTLLLLIALAALVFVVGGAVAINKPPTTDEVELAAAGLAVAHSGRPSYYLGEVPDRFIPEANRWFYHSGGQPFFQLGLWHASLYTFLIGLCFRLFGPENWAGRLSGALCLVVDLWIVARIVRGIVAVEHYAWALGLTLILFLCNPLLLQEGLMLDIDNTVMTTALLFFLHAYLWMERTTPAWWGRLLRLTGLFFLVCCTKEFAGGYLLVVVAGYEILARRWDRLAALLVAAGCAAGLFTLAWTAFCHALDLPADYFIAFSITRRLAKADGVLTGVIARRGFLGAVASIGKTLVHSATWVSPFYAALGIWAMGARLRRLWRERKPEPVDLLVIFVLFLLMLTKVIRPSGWFLKYEYPLYAPLTIVIGLWLAPRIPIPTPRALVVIFPLIGLVAFAQGRTLGDPVAAVYDLVVSQSSTASVLLLFYFLLGGALAGLLYLVGQRRNPGSLLITTLVIGLFGAQLGLAGKQLAPYTTAPDWPNYAEPSFAPVVAHLRRVLRPGDVPVCRKDIGFALRLGAALPGGRWIDNVVVARLETSRLPPEILAPEVSHIVLDRFSTRGDPAPFLLPLFVPDFATDGYLVLRRALPRREESP